MLDYNATFINDCGIALLNSLASTAGAGGSSSGTFVSPVSVMLALALLLNGAAPGSATFWCARRRGQLAARSRRQQVLTPDTEMEGRIQTGHLQSIGPRPDGWTPCHRCFVAVAGSCSVA